MKRRLVNWLFEATAEDEEEPRRTQEERERYGWLYGLRLALEMLSAEMPPATRKDPNAKYYVWHIIDAVKKAYNMKLDSFVVKYATGPKYSLEESMRIEAKNWLGTVSVEASVWSYDEKWQGWIDKTVGREEFSEEDSDAIAEYLVSLYSRLRARVKQHHPK